MKYRASRLALLAAATTLAVQAPAEAQLGNLQYQAAEVGKPLASFGTAVFGGSPGGSNTVIVLRGYLIVMGSHDSGKPDGPLHVFDVKNPRQPVLMKRFTSAETGDLRELHAMPVAMIDGKDYLVLPTTKGLRFFDFTDPLNPEHVAGLELEGVNGGDYDNAAWMLSWVWPHVYVGGTGNGVYVVDATDPAQPKLLERVATSELGGFRVGPVYGAGNYIVLSGMDDKPTKVSVLDASDPSQPFLIGSGAAGAAMYSTVVIGDRIYGAGFEGNYSFMSWSVSDGFAEVKNLTTQKFGKDKGGYCTYQDTKIFCGQSSEGYRIIDVSNETSFTELQSGDVEGSGADTDFATVLGNLIYLGNDHGDGAALIPHSMAPDTSPPEIVKTFPSDGELNQPLTSRFTAFFSDEIALETVNPETIKVRHVDGTPVDGVFSHSSINAISFGPRAPLLPDSTYEIVFVAGGVKDLAQNAMTEEVVVRFSTGAMIEEPMQMGGTGGMASSGGSAGSAPTAGGGLPDSGGAGSGGSGVAPAPMPGAAPAEESASGCGCSVPGSSRTGLSPWLLGFGLLVAQLGRRHNARRS